MENKSIHAVDVCIVGAGLVGLATAIALAQQGRRVCVVDAKDTTETLLTRWDTRIFALTPATQRWLHAIGVWQRLDMRRVSPVSAMALWATQSQSALQLAAEDANIAQLAYIVENQNLNNALLQQIATLDIGLFNHAACETVCASASSIELRLETGTTITADLLIAADGVNSFVRQACHIATKTKAFNQTALVANFSTSHPHGHIARQWFAPHETLALLPLTENKVSMVWCLPDALANQHRALDASALAKAVTLRSQQAVGELLPLGDIVAYALNQTTATQLIAPRVVLIGDAAHQIHPMAGQGLNLGFRDAIALTRLLSDAHPLQDIGENAFLRQYERSRKADIMRMNGLTTSLNAWFSSEKTFLHKLTRWSTQHLNNQAVLKKFLIEQAVA